jgi:large subunit ribosomal protein L25
MSKQQFVLQAKNRATTGKGESRRMRRKEGAVPAILYGADKAPANISISHKDLAYVLENESFYTSIVTLKVDGVDDQSAAAPSLAATPAARRLPARA